MNITDVRIRLIEKGDIRLKAAASIVVDNAIVIHDIKIIDGRDGYFVAMPSRKTPDGDYKDIVHPLNAESRNEICGVILAEFEKALGERQDI